MPRRDEPKQPSGVDGLSLPVDRRADVPIGVQIAWALRTKINEGVLQPGERMPGLRELAAATGVNVNTARAVYQRLELMGLVETRQGTGTFVAGRRPPSALGTVAALAAAEARDHGVSVREVAAALYVLPEVGRAGPAGDLVRRKLLRAHIAALELTASELEAQHSVVADARSALGQSDPGPRMLGLAELEATRAELVRRLAAVQAAIDNKQDDTPPGGGQPVSEARPAKAAKRPKQAAKRTRRPPRPGLAGAS
jgi:DNA-binding transcriptional regulator YhcF (GntR family)